MLLRLGNVDLTASLRRISSTKSNDDSAGLSRAGPPVRQLVCQTTSFGSARSLASIMCGAITTVSSSAPARKAADIVVRK